MFIKFWNVLWYFGIYGNKSVKDRIVWNVGEYEEVGFV